MTHRSQMAAAFLAATMLLATRAVADELLLNEDFSSGKAGEVWKQIFPATPAMGIEGGALNVRPGTVWCIPAKKFSVADLADGLRLAADMKLYPMPGYEWKPSSNFYPIGLQDSDGGVGTVYARFCLLDENGDGRAEAIRFQTSNGASQYSSTIPDFDASQGADFHQYRVDWYPDSVEAYLDGRRVASHAIAIGDPLWIVGRNELGGTLIKNLKVSALPPKLAVKKEGAAERIGAVAQKYGKLRMVIASPGYMWGIDRQIEKELTAAGMAVLAYPNVPMVTERPFRGSWENLSRYNVLIFGDGFIGGLAPDAGTGRPPAWVDTELIPLLRRFLEEGGGILICGHSEWDMAGGARTVNYVMKQLGMDAEIIPETVLDKATLVNLPTQVPNQNHNWCWTDAIVPGPLTEGVKGLRYPYSYISLGSLVISPVRVGPEWQALVKGLPSAASYAADPNSPNVSALMSTPGTVKSSPILIAARSYKKGRVVLWPMRTHFGVLCGSAPGVGGWLMDGDVDGKKSDGARLIENILCWLAQPSQGSKTVGTFVPPPTQETAAVSRSYPDVEATLNKLVLPGARQFSRQFKGLIGAHSNLSDGRNSPEEMIAAAKAAGYDFIVFTEDLTKMDKPKWDRLVAACDKIPVQALDWFQNRSSWADPADANKTFAAFPGLDVLDDAGDRSFVFGQMQWPVPEGFSQTHPGRLTWLYAYSYQLTNAANTWPARVVVSSKSNNKRPWHIAMWNLFAPYSYDGGKLVDDSMEEWLRLWGRLGYHRHMGIVAAHTVRSVEEVARAAQPELQQTFVRADSLERVLGEMVGVYGVLTAGGRCYFPTYVSNGPTVEEFQAVHSFEGETWDSNIPGGDAYRLHLIVKAPAGLKEIRIYRDGELFRRLLPQGREFEAIMSFHASGQVVHSIEVTDTNDRKATGWLSYIHNADSEYRRGGDNWNWMRTGRARSAPRDLIPWDGMETYAGSAAAPESRYWADMGILAEPKAFIFPAGQGIKVDAQAETRFPAATMDLSYVGHYGIIRTDEYRADYQVAEHPPISGSAMVYSWVYGTLPTPWPAEIKQYSFQPRFNGVFMGRIQGRVQFTREVSTPDNKPIRLEVAGSGKFGTTPLLAGIDPLNRRQGVLEVMNPDGSSVVRKMKDLQEGEVYSGEIPLNGYICWYGPDAPGVGGIVALSPGIVYSYGRKGLSVNRLVNSPAKPGTVVSWEHLLINGSGVTTNSDQEMEDVRAGMGLAGKPTLYRVEPRVGRVVGQRLFLDMAAEDGGVSGRIARSSDKLLPIPLPVRVEGLNPRWDAGIWYRGKSELEMVSSYRDRWGYVSPFRAGSAYEPRMDEIQRIPVLEGGTGYCQVDTDKQSPDVFIGNFLVCDQPDVFISMVSVAKGKCVFEINNPTDNTIICKVRPARGFDRSGVWERQLTLPRGGFQRVEVTPGNG